MRKKSRVLYLDIARCLAIVLVALNHSVNRCYTNYTDQIGEFQSIPLASSVFKAVMTVASHYGVPIFLMITGALLLPRKFETKEDVVRFYKHNWLKILITTEIWLFIMFWVKMIGVNREMLEPARLPEILRMLIKTLLFINQYTFDSMLYLSMILLVYLLIPVYALAIQKMSMFVLWIPAALVMMEQMIMPYVNSALVLMGSTKKFSLAFTSANLFSGYYLYLFAGYWIAAGGLAKTKSYLLYLYGTAIFVLMSVYQLWIYSREQDMLLSYNFPGFLLGAAILFELIRRNADKWSRFAPAFEFVSRRAFAIYFIHIQVMSVMKQLPFVPLLNRPMKLVYLEVGSLVGSLIIIEVLSRNRLLKKYMLYM